MMYTYIMKRTQIYLSDEEDQVLASRSAASGRTKSQLIREAIDSVYLGTGTGDALAAISRAAGSWPGQRESGADYVERRRTGRLSRLHDDG